jgi:hypothetical protein
MADFAHFLNEEGFEVPEDSEGFDRIVKLFQSARMTWGMLNLST